MGKFLAATAVTSFTFPKFVGRRSVNGVKKGLTNSNHLVQEALLITSSWHQLG